MFADHMIVDTPMRIKLTLTAEYKKSKGPLVEFDGQEVWVMEWPEKSGLIHVALQSSKSS